MPQVLTVLCCYSCKMFQVHIAKKAPKWQCKLCNEKQSLKRIYFQGSGKECRVHVQKLNMMKENGNQNIPFEGNDSYDNVYEDTCYEENPVKMAQSKWSKYLDPTDQSNVSEISSDNDEVDEDEIDEVQSDDSLHALNDNVSQVSPQINFMSNQENSNISLKEDLDRDNMEEQVIVNSSNDTLEICENSYDDSSYEDNLTRLSSQKVYDKSIVANGVNSILRNRKKRSNGSSEDINNYDPQELTQTNKRKRIFEDSDDDFGTFLTF